MNRHMLVRRTRWDDAAATLSEWWELYEYRRGWFGLGKRKWRRVMTEYYAGMGESYRDVVTGDRKWADKIAEYYDIKVPEHE